EEAVAYHCPSCGAEIVTDGTTAATFCYYCHNPVVLSGRVSGEFLPHKIIPFSIDKEEAIKKFLKYVQSKKFIPKAFFNKNQIDKISGVYFPYWMIDMDYDGQLQAEGKNVRVWRSGETEYTETKIYRVEREGAIHLEDITRNALQKANSKLSEGVLPYDVSQVKAFNMGFLSGFLAERRDIEQKELENSVQEEAKEYGEQILHNTITGYSSVLVKNCNLNEKKENWDYIMLPVWTVTYKGKNGTMYYYSMNGQNGKVYGELPLDYKKVWGLGSIISIVVLILGLIGGFFL
ncbi:MAG: TFIIB-type zinc ribbon-containing protein, partial [Lachnospiraceae bacterium]